MEYRGMETFSLYDLTESNEKIKYYNLAFPMFLSEITPRFHEYLLITYIRKGRGVFVIDSLSCDVKEGDIVVISPNTIYSEKPYENEEMFTTTFVVEKSFVCPVTSDDTVSKYILPVMNGSAGCSYVISSDKKGYFEFQEAVLSMCSAVQNKEKGFEIYLLGCFYSFFFLLYKYDIVSKQEKTTTEIKNESLIRNAIKYIEENYANQITVQELSSLCNFSSSYFMTQFKKYTGTTSSTFINNYRLLSASQMLIASNDSILAIALRCGFNNISFFNREFKKKFSVTPKEYRKQNI